MSNTGSFTAETAPAAARKSHGFTRQLLKHALEIEQFTHKVLLEMRESLSFSGETARENCQAVAAITRSCEGAMEQVRIQRGKPLPGSRRPAQEVPKAVKRKPLVKPPRSWPTPAVAQVQALVHSTG